MSAPSLKLCQQLKLFHSLEATLAQQVELLLVNLGPRTLKVEYSWIVKSFLSEEESQRWHLLSLQPE